MFLVVRPLRVVLGVEPLEVLRKKLVSYHQRNKKYEPLKSRGMGGYLDHSGSTTKKIPTFLCAFPPYEQFFSFYEDRDADFYRFIHPQAQALNEEGEE